MPLLDEEATSSASQALEPLCLTSCLVNWMVFESQRLSSLSTQSDCDSNLHWLSRDVNCQRAMQESS